MDKIANICRHHYQLPFPGMPNTKLPSAFHCVQAHAELVFIDPFILPEEKTSVLEALGTPTHVLITNQNHDRDAEQYRRRYGAKIMAHRDLADHFDFALDGTFEDEDPLPGGLRAIRMYGAFKGETIFLHPEQSGSLIVGDAIMNLQLGRYGVAGVAMRTVGWPEGPGTMPRLLMEDEMQAAESYRKLLRYPFSRILMSHGTPILTEARSTLLKGLGNNQSVLPYPVRRAVSKVSINVWEWVNG